MVVGAGVLGRLLHSRLVADAAVAGATGQDSADGLYMRPGLPHRRATGFQENQAEVA